jgi:hypothetical protein
MAGRFSGALVTEIRVYDNPKTPNDSDYRVMLPMTVTDAVTDPNTGETVEEMLRNKVVDSLEGNETDKAPSVAAIKAALGGAIGGAMTWEGIESDGTPGEGSATWEGIEAA